jgi:hypothetical protein
MCFTLNKYGCMVIIRKQLLGLSIRFMVRDRKLFQHFLRAQKRSYFRLWWELTDYCYRVADELDRS